MFTRDFMTVLLAGGVVCCSVGLSMQGCSKSAEEVESTEPAVVKGGGSAAESRESGGEATSGYEGAADQQGAETGTGGNEPMSGNGGADAPALGQSADGASFALPGLVFDKPAAWVNEMPSSSMRAAQFTIPAPAKTEGDESADGPATQLVVFFFGPSGAGGIQDNFVRWADQIAQPDGSASMDHAVTSEKEVNGMKVHLIEVNGTQVAETTPGSGVRLNNPDFILLAAIVESPAGPYYFKLVGPTATIGPFKAEFAAMVESFHAP